MRSLTLPANTSSTACTAPPAARITASNVPGDIVVSASSRTMPSLRRGLAHLLDVFHRMRQRDRFERGHRRLLARQRLEFLVLERALDRAQPVGPLGMPHRRQMIEAGRMAEQQCGHAVRILFGNI